LKETTFTSPYGIIKMDKENDILVVDPYLININDFVGTGVKHIVRTRRPSWGRGVHVKICKQGLFSKLLKGGPKT